MKALFIHHSTGGNLVVQGHLRKLLQERIPDLELFDQGYNKVGLRRLLAITSPSIHGFRNAKGIEERETIFIPHNNTDPDGLEELFTKSREALDQMLQYDVIHFKSCFPVCAIKSDEQLEQYKNNYIAIRDVIRNNPNNIFIPFTPPPLRAEQTTKKEAERARSFADWLISADYVQGLANLKPFNFFNVLVEADGIYKNTLKRDFCRGIFFDSHPNKRANDVAAHGLVDFLSRVLYNSN